jgi:hypothetical protein
MPELCAAKRKEQKSKAVTNGDFSCGARSGVNSDWQISKKGECR